jgi:hypothetical protein
MTKIILKLSVFIALQATRKFMTLPASFQEKLTLIFK